MTIISFRDLEAVNIKIHQFLTMGYFLFISRIIESVVFSLQVTVKNLAKPKSVYYFPCDKWLSKDEDDKQIVRQLLGTKNLDNVKQGMDLIISKELNGLDKK